MIRGLFTIFFSNLVLAIIFVPSILLSLILGPNLIYAVLSFTWAKTILVPSGIRIETEGIEHIRNADAQVLVGNHQSALDIPVLLVVCRGHLRFLAKKSLFKIPVFGWLLRWFKSVPVDRSNARVTQRSLDIMMKRMEKAPLTFAIFAEGTRSDDGTLLPFKRGTMKICQRAGLDVVPFSIDGTNKAHTRGEFSVRPTTVRVCFGKPIPAERVSEMSTDELLSVIRSAVELGIGRSGNAQTLVDAEPLVTGGT